MRENRWQRGDHTIPPEKYRVPVYGVNVNVCGVITPPGEVTVMSIKSPATHVGAGITFALTETTVFGMIAGVAVAEQEPVALRARPATAMAVPVGILLPFTSATVKATVPASDVACAEIVAAPLAKTTIFCALTSAVPHTPSQVLARP